MVDVSRQCGGWGSLPSLCWHSSWRGPQEDVGLSKAQLRAEDWNPPVQLLDGFVHKATLGIGGL